MTNKNDKCYVCGKPATTRDHIPPKCIFPESKDIPGTKYRDNPIIVPACVEHNCSRSSDDEYFAQVISVVWGNNDIAEKQFDTKILRSFNKEPTKSIKLANGWIDVEIEGGISTKAIRLDDNRIKNVMTAIFQGLHFHEFSSSAKDEVAILPLFSTSGDNSVNSAVNSAVAQVIDSAPFGEYKGANPDVFKYRYVKSPENTQTIWELTFYNHAKVYGVSSSRDD